MWLPPILHTLLCENLLITSDITNKKVQLSLSFPWNQYKLNYHTLFLRWRISRRRMCLYTHIPVHSSAVSLSHYWQHQESAFINWNPIGYTKVKTQELFNTKGVKTFLKNLAGTKNSDCQKMFDQYSLAYTHWTFLLISSDNREHMEAYMHYRPPQSRLKDSRDHIQAWMVTNAWCVAEMEVWFNSIGSGRLRVLVGWWLRSADFTNFHKFCSTELGNGQGNWTIKIWMHYSVQQHIHQAGSPFNDIQTTLGNLVSMCATRNSI